VGMGVSVIAEIMTTLMFCRAFCFGTSTLVKMPALHHLEIARAFRLLEMLQRGLSEAHN
jgi:hypothetical protein